MAIAVPAQRAPDGAALEKGNRCSKMKETVLPKAPRVQWMTARGERDYDKMEALSALILQRRPQDDLVRRSLAHLLQVLGREDEAMPHWQFMADLSPTDFEAAFNIARAAFLQGDNPTEAAAAAAPLATPAFQASLADALLEPAPVLQGDFNHVAICGTAYCGSTLIDRLLGGLCGVRSIGESHWLTKVRLDDRYADVVMSEPLETARWVPCTGCGAGCETLTPRFRRSLMADKTHWYRKIAAQLGSRHLVSADKNLPKLVEKDPLLELSGLVVFKSPEQAWHSHLVKLRKDHDAAWYEEECLKYLNTWGRSYRSYLDHFRPQGEVVFLNFDAFTRDPEPLLRAVCARLKLPFDREVLRRTAPGHAIGGNAGSMRRLREKDYAVHIESLPEPEIDPRHRELIAADDLVQRTWRDMMALHNSMAAPAAA